MAIKLGGIALPDVVMLDEFGIPGINATATPTAGGGVNVQEYAIVKGKRIDLIGGEDFAWITRSSLSSIKTLSDVPMATYVLQYESTNYTVRFRNEEPPSVFAEPLVPRPNQGVSDYYKNLFIKLMRV